MVSVSSLAARGALFAGLLLPATGALPHDSSRASQLADSPAGTATVDHRQSDSYIERRAGGGIPDPSISFTRSKDTKFVHVWDLADSKKSNQHSQTYSLGEEKGRTVSVHGEVNPEHTYATVVVDYASLELLESLSQEYTGGKISELFWQAWLHLHQERELQRGVKLSVLAVTDVGSERDNPEGGDEFFKSIRDTLRSQADTWMPWDHLSQVRHGKLNIPPGTPGDVAYDNAHRKANAVMINRGTDLWKDLLQSKSYAGRLAGEWIAMSEDPATKEELDDRFIKSFIIHASISDRYTPDWDKIASYAISAHFGGEEATKRLGLGLDKVAGWLDGSP